ncbi:hypothetical protein Slin15195_G100840 [Septoria linicola]|uniref:Uncharacterized protein n=1 Tax=Septoria linicola TaxID=215465 RepID=A0A9Q9AX58_9PEZI|nr:hypothetical protein Slin14017_G063860 [Septoria linicola]USW56765.1 hypothetical protein Slin15195_G100840 [Septoria linicola]
MGGILSSQPPTSDSTLGSDPGAQPGAEDAQESSGSTGMEVDENVIDFDNSDQWKAKGVCTSVQRRSKSCGLVGFLED